MAKFGNLLENSGVVWYPTGYFEVPYAKVNDVPEGVDLAVIAIRLGLKKDFYGETTKRCEVLFSTEDGVQFKRDDGATRRICEALISGAATDDVSKINHMLQDTLVKVRIKKGKSRGVYDACYLDDIREEATE